MAHAVIMPKAGMSMETGTILRWLKSPGEPVRRGEPLLEIETDKLAMEVESEVEGVLLAIVHGPGDVVRVTEVIGYVGAAGEAVPSASAAPAAPPVATPSAPAASPALVPVVAPGGPLRASPLARTVARQRGLDLAGIRGTGPGGAIRVRDLPALVAAATEATAAGGAPVRKPLSSVRRAIATRMTQSHREIPAVTLHTDTDVTELERIRGRWNHGGGSRLSLTPFLLRAAALACREHELLRSSLDGDELLTWPQVDLGMAVALEGGLIVPVLRGADRLGVAALADRAGELGRSAREGKLTPADVSGAVFTVTNLGMYGVTSFDPLIDPPQSAILGVGAVRDRLTLVDGRVEARSCLDLALCFDHRVMDGAQAAQALQTIRRALESPLELLL